MTLRARLAVWYGALFSAVLALSLTFTYLTHTDEHNADTNAALRAAVERSADEVSALLADDPIAPLTMRQYPDALSEPLAVWAFRGPSSVPAASRGATDDPAFAGATVASAALGLSDQQWTIGPARTYAVHVDPDVKVVGAVSLVDIGQAQAQLRASIVTLAVAAIALAVYGGWALSGHALRPIAILTETARAIAGSRGFGRRVEVPPADPELTALATTFNDMLDALEGAYRAQQRFVADASHELRTPLTALRGGIELLGSGDAKDDAALVAQLKREVGRLSRLVEDLLVLARADAGNERQRNEELELDEVVMEAFDEMRASAGARLHVDALEPLTIVADRDRITQVALALIDNAQRYAPEGRIGIALRRDGDAAVLTVEDEGIGVGPDDASHAFERFYRGRAARALDPTGSGLGLAIVRWIVERYGGTVALEPRERKGTRAVVRLPLVPRAATS